MPTNIYKTPGYKRLVAVSDPAAPASGDPVRYGSLTGLCLVPENAAGEAVCDFGPGEWIIPVTGETGAVSPGDALFYDDAIHAVNNDSVNGYFFGFALGSVGNGLTADIHVFHVPSPGAGTVGAGTIGTAALANGAVTAAKIAGGGVDRQELSTIADANTSGGVPVIHRINIAGGAAGNTDVVLAAGAKIRVIDVWAVHTGGAGEANDTIQVKNGANAITNAMDWSGADETIVRASSINDANHEIAAGGTLRVTTTDNDAGNDVGAGVVYVLGIPVA